METITLMQKKLKTWTKDKVIELTIEYYSSLVNTTNQLKTLHEKCLCKPLMVDILTEMTSGSIIPVKEELIGLVNNIKNNPDDYSPVKKNETKKVY